MDFLIPERIQVGGFSWPVLHKRGLIRNEGKLGTITYCDRAIHIDPDQLDVEKQETFLHEALHAVDDIFDCKLDESQTKRLAHGLFQVIRQLEADIGRPNPANLAKRDLVHGLPGG